MVSACAGERWAQEALFRRYARLVNGLAYRLLPSEADADDLVQDVFVQAFQNLDRLQNQQAFGSWIASIVVRTAHKRLRRNRLMTRLGLRRPEPVDLDALLSSAAPPDAAAEARAIYALVDRLTPEERVVLILRRVEGLSLAEIATQVGKSQATVKRRLSAAQGRMQHLLRSAGGGND